MEGWIIGLIIVVLLILIVCLVIYKLMVIVHQAEGMVIERLGRFHKVLQAGVNWLVPFIDSKRTFTWKRTYINVHGIICEDNAIDNRIDLRESVFNFVKCEVYTKDTILLTVNTLMYYRIVDIRKAIYEVDDLHSAISNVAQTQLKEVFGRMTFSTSLTAQDSINHHMVSNFAEMFAKWGIHVERMELIDMSPKAVTYEAMKKQMLAERSRRSDFIIAEGKKSAMRLTSEGTKIVKFQMGVAEQESLRKESEGQSGAKVTLAQAESKALEIVGKACKSDNASQSEYMVTQRYLELFRSMVNNVSDKVVYLPYEASNLTGLVGGLHSVYGAKAVPPPVDKDKYKDIAIPEAVAGGAADALPTRTNPMFASGAGIDPSETKFGVADDFAELS